MAVLENMSWNEEFKYRILGSRIELEGKTALAFYLDEPIIVVPAKRKCQNAEKSEIISKEVLPVDTEEIAADDIAADGVVEKTQSRSTSMLICSLSHAKERFTTSLNLSAASALRFASSALATPATVDTRAITL